MSPTAIPGNLILQSPAANDPLLDLNTQPSLDLQFATSKTLNDRVSGQNLITFSRSTTGTYVDSNGIIQTAAIDTPRFDHDPTTGESLGLLIEESRTNIITSSSVFNTGGWVQDGIILTANAGVAPDGTTTATSLSQGTGNNRCFYFDNTGSGNKTLTIFAKSNVGSSIAISGNLFYGTNSVGSIVLNTANGTVSNASGCSSVALPNGWYRFIIPINVSTGFGNTNYIEIKGPASSVFIWGVQIETGSFPTSYIPTTTSAVTRAADVATIEGTNFSSWFNQSEGTVFTDLAAKGVSSIDAAFAIGSSGDADRWLQQYFLPSSVFYEYEQAAPPAHPYTIGSFIKSAIGRSQGDNAVGLNGSIVQSDTYSGSYNPVFLKIGVSGDPNRIFNGHISRLAYFPTRKTDQKLIDLTT